VKRLAADRSRWKSFVAALCSSTGDDRKWWCWCSIYSKLLLHFTWGRSLSTQIYAAIIELNSTGIGWKKRSCERVRKSLYERGGCIDYVTRGKQFARQKPAPYPLSYEVIYTPYGIYHFLVW
jgi:hypothetical protein